MPTQSSQLRRIDVELDHLIMLVGCLGCFEWIKLIVCVPKLFRNWHRRTQQSEGLPILDSNRILHEGCTDSFTVVADKPLQCPAGGHWSWMQFGLVDAWSETMHEKTLALAGRHHECRIKTLQLFLAAVHQISTRLDHFAEYRASNTHHNVNARKSFHLKSECRDKINMTWFHKLERLSGLIPAEAHWSRNNRSHKECGRNMNDESRIVPGNTHFWRFNRLPRENPILSTSKVKHLQLLE